MVFADPYLLALSKLAEKIAELLRSIRKEKIRRNKAASTYFAALAKAMESVLTSLQKREIPRIAGHEMETLLRAFEEKTKNVMSQAESMQLRQALAEVSNEARTLDSHYIFHLSEVEAERTAKLQVIERIVGDLRGLAGRFSEEAGG
jgi:hypothetical protein